MNQEEQIAALQQKIAFLEEQIECLEIRTSGHSRSIENNSDMREIEGRITERMLNMIADHIKRLKAIEAHLWPGVAREPLVVRSVPEKTGNPPGNDLDRRD